MSPKFRGSVRKNDAYADGIRMEASFIYMIGQQGDGELDDDNADNSAYKISDLPKTSQHPDTHNKYRKL